MRVYDLMYQKIKILFLVVLLLVTGLSVIGFTFRFYEKNDANTKVYELEQSLLNLKSAMNIDSIRQYQIQKIIRIIDKYNPDMESALKYEVANEICLMAVKYPHLDVDLISATITHESALTWRPDVKSYAGAMGLMQIMPSTGVLLAESEGVTWTAAAQVLNNPILNIRLGCRYLDALIESYDTDGGLAAYNGGAKRAALWLANNRDYSYLWEETRGYVPAVLKLYEQYKNQKVL
ncbi:transglycosylase SLT domain-containing protein [bacterium]|nr:transglycosylase SLT domain-containing protein [bacterium]